MPKINPPKTNNVLNTGQGVSNTLNQLKENQNIAGNTTKSENLTPLTDDATQRSLQMSDAMNAKMLINNTINDNNKKAMDAQVERVKKSAQINVQF